MSIPNPPIVAETSSALQTTTVVTYSCSCGRSDSLMELYFCQECKKTKCSRCVTEEIDAYYCPNCLENMPSAEAMLFSNRCSKCFECPDCGITLHVFQSAEDQYYLRCGFCQWDSRHLDLAAERADKIPTLNITRERDADHIKEVTAIVENCKRGAKEHAKEKEQAKKSRRYLSLAMPAFNMAALPPVSFDLVEAKLKETSENVTKSMASLELTEISDVPDELYQSFDLEQVTSLEQRSKQSATQPRYVDQLFPQRRHLLTKQAKRCCDCEKFVVKPDINPSSITFKKRDIALAYVPRIHIDKASKLTPFKQGEVILQIVNPVDEVVFFSIIPLPSPSATHEGSEEEGSASTTIPVAATLDRLRASVTQPVRSNTEVDFTNLKESYISAYNEMLEHDDTLNDDDDASPPPLTDDPLMIISRSGHKVNVRIPLTLHVDSGDQRPVFEFLFKCRIESQTAAWSELSSKVVVTV
eukprot:GFYU01013179.1.p1 GENE.GFYU01013179.1~~GFYU01013179.1.p1  ORF type:complete len:471 (-),score=119.26 GFYU01013179.1:118-1530(-)